MMTVLLALSACGGPSGELPARYRDLRVPDGLLASAPARERGRGLFLQHCAICHGVSANGRGQRSEGLNPPPMDFTNPDWSTSVTPKDVFLFIHEGVPGTAMPAWKTLDERQTWDLVAYVLSVGKS